VTDSIVSGSAHEDDSAAVLRLGARIRQLRKVRGLTLVQLATATELSHPFLSQLERGLAQPSLGSLRRIAVALETSPIELIAASEEPLGSTDIELRRAGSGAVPEGFAAGTARMLTHGARPFHPMEVTSDAVAPGASFTHDEEEFLYVVEGNVVVELSGETYPLGPGDAIYYGGGVSHRWWSSDGAPYRLLVVKEGARLRSHG
jgi:transcriptional regulator with XRE-family HTH domain